MRKKAQQLHAQISSFGVDANLKQQEKQLLVDIEGIEAELQALHAQIADCHQQLKTLAGELPAEHDCALVDTCVQGYSDQRLHLSRKQELEGQLQLEMRMLCGTRVGNGL